MGPEHIATYKLAHGHAITGHRAQGSTVDASYVLEDGGGRELAYVAMSRARAESHVYVAALVMERGDLARSVPPDQSQMLDHVRGQRAIIEADRRDLFAGTGRWAGTGVAEAVHALATARQDHQEALKTLEDPGSGLWARRVARRDLKDASTRFDNAHQLWDNTGEPHARWLRAQSDNLAPQVAQLEAAQAARAAYLAEHPEVPGRLADLDRAIQRGQELQRLRSWDLVRQRHQDRHLGISQEVERGYGIDL
jgi:primosomal protein N''